MSTNYINKITDTAGTTHDIMEGVDTRIFRATCNTTAGTAAKVATLDDATNFSLTTGVRVAVTFTHGNTAATPTLNVNSTGAKTIAVWANNNSIMTSGGTTYYYFGSYETLIFTYSGTYWILGQGGAIYKAYSLAESKTSNTGTVTQVTAGTGLSVDSTAGGSFTTSGTINHTNSITATTSQKLYPISIDAQGHISEYDNNTPITVSNDGTVIINNADIRLSYDKAIKWEEYAGYISGDTETGSLTIGNNTDYVYIHNLATPVADTDAATKAYVDSSAGGGGSKSSFYGTCSTTSSTAEKAVTCTSWEFVSGNIIGILFTTANTAATPTLNINSAGAKTICIGASSSNSTNNVLKWSANTVVYFIYDGTYFRYITSSSAGSVQSSRGAGTWYGTSSTSAATTAKTSTIANYVLTQGAVATITFSTANTAVAPTLNINSTGAKAIYNGNAITSATNPLYWEAGETITFIYSGSYYYVVNQHTKVNNLSDTEYTTLAWDLADEYSSASTYEVGDFAITVINSEENLIECITDITTPETYNSSHWQVLAYR